MSAELGGILFYLVLQFVIGTVIYRRINTENDYFLAGRSLGIGIASLSIFATWFGAETVMGAAGAIWESGLSGSRADPFGYTVCLLLMALFLASRLRKANYVTLADLFRRRFSPGVERMAVILMIPTSLMWAAAQVRAFGQILSASSDLEVQTAITVAAMIVISYTVLGGLMADAITDVLQGGVLILGLAILLGVLVHDLGGISAAAATVSTERLSFVGAGSESLLARLDTWMIPILGSLVAQELIARVLSTRSAKVARNATLSAAAIYLVVGLIPVSIGLLGPALMPNMENPEQLIPALAKAHLPLVFYILLAGALVSAILSTVDSTLLASSSLFSHNLVLPLMKSPTEKQKVYLARVGVASTGIIAYVMALFADGIYDLVEMASAYGSSGLLVITLFGLYGRFGGRAAAYASLAVGLVSIIAAENWLGYEAPFLFSMISAVVTYVSVAAVTALVPALSGRPLPVSR